MSDSEIIKRWYRQAVVFNKFEVKMLMDKARLSEARVIFNELEKPPKDDKSGNLFPIISPVIGWRERERYERLKLKHSGKWAKP